MSTSVAIAATTQMLASIVDEAVAAFSAISSLIGIASTTALPPDLITTGDKEVAHLNLFLYKVGFNAGWRDFGLPSRDSDSGIVSRPPLALDLHYILSAYANADFLPEALIGIGMQALHETPVLNRGAIRQFYRPPRTNSDPTKTLATANLADQVETIKISPQDFSTEEMSKLWTAFQAKYRLSAAYLATVVLIESSGPVKSVLPVRKRALFVLPFQQASIDSVEPQALPLTAGAAIAINGQNLFSPMNSVRFGNGDHQQPDLSKSNTAQLTVPLPATLTSGVNTVQVVRQLTIGAPSARDLLESNVAAFLLQPTIQTITPSATDITVTVSPLVLEQQKVTLLLNQLNPLPNQQAAFFVLNSASLPAAPTATVVFATSGVPAGNYFLRVRVDGADSALTTDANGVYNGPKVTV